MNFEFEYSIFKWTGFDWNGNSLIQIIINSNDTFEYKNLNLKITVMFNGSEEISFLNQPIIMKIEINVYF
jgi:hypothetical protein